MNRYTFHALADGKYLFDQQTGRLWKLVLAKGGKLEWVLQTLPLEP